ncbi:MAG: Flp pilus assembly complex ATPase component TadA [Phycisphaerales bacterium]|nr:Flp pilus assembly complex ATPase component TadA [Planctomycetota bacterium]MCH8509645.1 Flp pilus assembly complex ATPase component TadA [Phycisphaerales bacterium]
MPIRHGLSKRTKPEPPRAPTPGGLARVQWDRVSEVFGPLRMSPDQLRSFARLDGSDDEPWDVMLQAMALDEATALRLLADRTGLEFRTEPRLTESASRFYEVVPADTARQGSVAAIEVEDGVFTLAISRPMQPSVVSMLEDLLDAPVRLVLSPRAAVANLINRGYEQRGDLVTEIVEDMPLDASAIEKAAGAIGKTTDLLAQARQTPVIRLVNMILFEALRRRASDIHVHPMEDKLVIRFRVDGMLVDAFNPPQSLSSAISSRLKVMTELDIANRHSPQDGQTSVRIGTKKIDIRLSVIPTIFGERIVLRLLDQSQTQLDLDAVGMSKGLQTRLMDCVERPNGILLVTGPTGSGKTTTLYAALGRIDRASRNVMTIEDPVEYHLDGISQMQVNPKRGVTFANGLRALLRQDPDVILVGEVRDSETAQLAIQASLTGHLVLATLHTNDAPSAIPRLLDIGVEPYLVTSSLLGVLAQRLLRKVCTACNGTGRVDAGQCEQCFGTGYRGRLAVHELMMMTDELRRLTGERADGVTLYETAVNGGFEPMKIDAMEKVAMGLTDEAEVFRVLH